MPKKKKDNEKTLTGLEGLAEATSITPEDVVSPPDEPAEDEETSTDEPTTINMAEAKSSKDDYFEERMWHGKIKTHCCKECGHFEEKEGDMILHVLKHVPAKDRNAVLDDLTR